ncbi:MAG: hypothetical protein QNI97_01905 [Desulfobacterales bacterium]|nr:hypothetical protein [Desulfobacterales bacterium]
MNNPINKKLYYGFLKPPGSPSRGTGLRSKIKKAAATVARQMTAAFLDPQ